MGALNNALMRRVLEHPWRLRLVVLLATALLTLSITQIWGSVLSLWDEQSGSAVWNWERGSSSVERRVVLVDIDEKSIQALGAWPWPRERMAKLVGRLEQAGASLTMLDILFDQTRQGDGALRRSLSSAMPTVPAELFALQEDQIRTNQGRLSGAMLGMACPASFTQGQGFLAPAADLGNMAGVGHITPMLDSDGAIRRVPAVICFEHQGYLSLPLAGAWVASHDEPIHLVRGVHGSDPAWWLNLGSWRIPLDEQGAYRISYAVPRSHWLSVSAVDLLQDKVPPAVLKGAWVVMGATAFGAGDVVPTPQGGAVGGMEIHAQTLAALLDERMPYTPRWAMYWPILAGCLVSMLLLLTLRGSRRSVTVTLPLLAVLLPLALYGAHGVVLWSWHWWLGWDVPALYAVLSVLALAGGEHLRTRLAQERLYVHLSSYLPQAVARDIAQQDPEAEVQALRREATVLAVDLRNFSAFCEGRAPEEAATLLHLFYTAVTQVVEAHGGVVEQMAGDGLLALWNGSEACADHGVRALEATRKLWKLLNGQLPILSSRDMPLIDVGMGLESGSVLVGSFGPVGRRAHTVLGETVSVALALQEMTGELACPVLLGAGLASRVQSSDVQSLGQFLLPGLRQARTLYQLKVAPDTERLRLVYDAEQPQQAQA